MKPRFLPYFILCLILCLTSCSGFFRKLFKRATNEFEIVTLEGIQTKTFDKFNPQNIFILRVKEVPKVDVVIDKNDPEGSHIISDIPFRSFEVVNDAAYQGKDVIEETYLYLHNLTDSSGDEGFALYFITSPITGDRAELYFCNNKFISTYSIRQILVGKWAVSDNTISISFDVSDPIFMTGSIKQNTLWIDKVNHPKPNRYSMDQTVPPIIVKDVFNLGCAEGLAFHRNMKRPLIYPDWDELGKKFDMAKNGGYYNNEVLSNRNITRIRFESCTDPYKVYFWLNNQSLIDLNINILKYRGRRVKEKN